MTVELVEFIQFVVLSNNAHTRLRSSQRSTNESVTRERSGVVILSLSLVATHQTREKSETMNVINRASRL